jgi:hypothetical protein
MLNQSSFTDYHRLGSSARIVSEKPLGLETDQSADLPPSPASDSPADALKPAQTSPFPQLDNRP